LHSKTETINAIRTPPSSQLIPDQVLPVNVSTFMPKKPYEKSVSGSKAFLAVVILGFLH
jgi:hypothetical protein